MIETRRLKNFIIFIQTIIKEFPKDIKNLILVSFWTPYHKNWGNKHFPDKPGSFTSAIGSNCKKLAKTKKHFLIKSGSKHADSRDI